MSTIATNVVHLRMYQSCDAQRIENGFYFQYGGTPAASALQALVADALQRWAVEILPVVSNDHFLRGAYAVSLDSATAPSYEEFLSSPQAGNLTSPGLPNNCALVIKFSTAFRGRANRGRIYHAGLTDNQVTQNTVNGTDLNDIVGAYQNFISGVETSAGAQHVVISRTTSPATVRSVTSIGVTDSTIDSQRRRLPGRGI